jgi:[acyl-carrier-protein] S-malonyltransferase
MKPAGERLEKILEGIVVQDLKVPVVTNVEAEINTLNERVKGLLVAQVSSPVRWEESMRRMTEDGIEQVLEIGPGKVLTGLMKRINPKVETKNLEDLETLRKVS